MKLSETIRILNENEAELLVQDKLPKGKYQSSGLYLMCKTAESYTAYDYYDRQNWLEMFGEDSAPEGWSKEFRSPLRAIDWLLETRRQ